MASNNTAKPQKMNNANSEVNKLEQQLQDIKEQVSVHVTHLIYLLIAISISYSSLSRGHGIVSDTDHLIYVSYTVHF